MSHLGFLALAAHAGIAEWANDRRTEAMAEWRRAAGHAAAARMPNVEAAALGFLTVRAAAAGEPDPVGLFRDILTRLRELRIVSYQYWALSGLAHWLATQDRVEQAEDAARILGFLDRANPNGNQSVADLRAEAAQLVDAHPAAPRWRAEGAAMTRDQVMERCLTLLVRDA